MEKHDLHNEFPEFEEKIHEMKTHNSHFRRLFDEYHEVNQATYRIETGVEPASDEVLNQHRIKRLKLKDELFDLLSK